MNLQSQIIPSLMIVMSTVIFLVCERIFPGRELPNTKNWYLRSVSINLIQLLIVCTAGLTWDHYFRSHSLMEFGNWKFSVLEGLFYWFIGTFVFYWWHRLRHTKRWWLAFHQLHHSPSRIEVLTAFYKHPIEILTNSVLVAAIIYGLFGGSPIAGAWYSFFAATGEYFYHANLRTPRWLGYFLQRPEHHSIHHQLDVHSYNFADITWWDRMFGTFKDTDEFAKACGFPNNHEEKIKDILCFKDVY